MYPSETQDRVSPIVPNNQGGLEDRDLGLPVTTRAALYGGTWGNSLGDVVQNNTGLLLVAGAQAFHSLMDLSVKILEGNESSMTALQLIAVRMGITYICCIFYMLIARVPNPFFGPKGVRTLLMFRGLCGFIAMFGLYFSLGYLSLSDATVITFLTPTFTAVVSAVILHETVTRKEVLAGMCSLFGVMLIARPASLFPRYSRGETTVPEYDSGEGHMRVVAVCVAFLGVCGATGAYTIIRNIGMRAHPLHVMTYFSMQCSILAPIGMLVTRTPFTWPAVQRDRMLLLLIGLFGFTAQLLLTMGFQREAAGRGSMAMYILIVFATILERIFFGTVPSVLSVVGTLIIMFSAVFIFLNKRKHVYNGQQNSVALPIGENEGLLDRAPV